MLYNKISELTREDMDIKRVKIDFVKQELCAKMDKNDTGIKFRSKRELPATGWKLCPMFLDGREAMCDAFIIAIKFIYIL